jgi:transcription elongation factor GreA-like protein
MNYVFNLDNIMAKKSYVQSTRLLAIDIKTNGYASLKDFFNDMPEEDLEAYLEMMEHFEDTDSNEGEELVLLASMLALAEGIDPGLNDDNEYLELMSRRCNQLFFLLTIESLARKGLVRFYRENISFGEDMLDKILCEKI